MQFMIVLVAIFAISSAIATFIENDYGRATAWAEVYGTKWFELIQLLLAFNLIGNIFKFKMFKVKKLPIVMFHIGFLVVLVGSAVTRYYGFEGLMHIREGERSNSITTLQSFMKISAKKDGEFYYSDTPLTISKISQNSFKLDLNIDGKMATLKYHNMLSKPKDDAITMTLNLDYDGEVQQIDLLAFSKTKRSKDVRITIKDVEFIISWGSKRVTIPYSIELKKFELKRYPGSMSPSSYASYIILHDKKNSREFDYKIFMNHVLDYQNHRFYQSSYDTDEKGTILSVNSDPGKVITYIAYALISIGLILNLFYKSSRFRYLMKLVQKDTIAKSIMLFLSISLTNIDLKASPIDEAKVYTKEHANTFGNLLVQKNDGRIVSISAFSNDILLKLAKTSSIYGLNSNQVLLGMITSPQIWQDIPVIRVKHDKIKEILGVGKNTKYLAYNDFFDFNNKNLPYKLLPYLEKSHKKPPTLRDTFDRKLIQIDERLNITYMIYTGSILRIVPKLNDQNSRWYSIKDAITNFPKEESQKIKTLFLYYFSQIEKSKKSGNWDQPNKAVNLLSIYQQKVGSAVIPSKDILEVETLFVKINLFNKLTAVYLIGGLILLFGIFIKMIKIDSDMKVVYRVGKTIIFIAFAIHTIGMIIRWYIGGHAPWSNAYEAMLYISWSMGLAGIVFSRYSILAPALTSVIASAVLFTTILTEMDPQITNLVPVLKSYWLNIHVSVLTASYGFLGLSMILGLFSLILFIINSEKRIHIKDSIIEATRINEMTAILGLTMLTIGTFLGGVWANESWGRYWSWDPKETWSWISILVYVILIHIRFIPSLTKNYYYNFAALSLVSYATIIMTFVGVNYYLSGMHSYAAGDPMPIPKYLYLIVAIVLILIALAYRKRELK
jgi:cytochrome c-type biogenesis protein CcsB